MKFSHKRQLKTIALFNRCKPATPEEALRDAMDTFRKLEELGLFLTPTPKKEKEDGRSD